jgi:hypothetical protein
VVVDVGVVEEGGRPDDLEARRLWRDEKERLLAFGDGQDDVEAWVTFARHEPLLAVDDPAVSVSLGRRGDCAHVRPRTRLGDRPGLSVLAADDRGHEALDLLGCRKLEELARAAVDHCEAEAVRRLPGLLLQCDLAEHGKAAPSQLLRHVEHRESRLSRLAPELLHLAPIHRASLGDRDLEWVCLLLDEGPHALLELADLFGQLGNDHGGLMLTGIGADEGWETAAEPCAAASLRSTR